jgi:hypothetical protein
MGRHILIHTPAPLSLNANVVVAPEPGGLAIFREYDFSVAHKAHPESPLRDQILRLF